MTSAVALAPAVLVVEDDAATAELEIRALRRAGRTVRTTDSVADAVAILRAEPVQAVVLDFRLRDGQAWPVLEAAQDLAPRVPVIVVTAMGDERVAAEAVHRGVADYLIKAGDFPERLILALNRVLEVVAAERSQARLASIVESSRDAILGLSLDGTIQSWNAGAEALFGHEATEIEGRSVSLCFPEERRVEFAALLRRAGRGESVPVLETAGLRKDGRPLDLSLTISAVRDRAGRATGASMIARDISDRRRAEREQEALRGQLLQSQKMEAVGRLAGGIAHDFNNLLCVINGYSQLALDRLSPADPLWKELDEVRKAGERAAGLTRQLLAFSRKQTVQPTVLDLDALVANMETLLRRLIGEDVDLKVALGTAGGRVKADPVQIEQVLVNLVVNARDAMPKGGIVAITTAREEIGEGARMPSGSYVRLEVKDSGTGMTEEVRRHLFEPFFTTKEPGKGTGLGLATVYGVVLQSRGRIEVDSEPGRGCSFRVYLPRVEEELAPAEAAGPTSSAPRGSGTILLVEDSEVVRTYARRVLEGAGYGVLEAETGEDAVLRYRAHPGRIDLVLTDVVMPRMSGPELLARLAESNPGLKAVYMSGYAEGTRGIELRPDVPFIEKPFSPAGLLRKIREALESSA